MEKNNIKVYRTVEGTIFEVAFLILAIIVWGLIIWFVKQAPYIVPTHFDASGNPNAWGSPTGIIVPCSIITPHCIAVPSAQAGLTSLFGMGRGGTPLQ